MLLMRFGHWEGERLAVFRLSVTVKVLLTKSTSLHVKFKGSSWRKPVQSKMMIQWQ